MCVVSPPPDTVAYDAECLAQDNGKATLGVAWALVALSAAVLGLRVYAKLTRGRRLWYDDHILLASWLFLLGNAILLTKMVALGYGKHSVAVSPAHVKDLVLLGNIALTFTVTALSWSKTSFAVTLLRLSSSWTKKSVWFIIVSMNLFFFWTALVHWIYCTPVAKSWNPFLDGKCWNYIVVANLDIVACAYSATMDIILSLLAWFVVKDLTMGTREKVGMMFSLGLGVVAGGFAIVKCTYLPTMLDRDILYTGTYLAIWGVAEITATIVASSIPVLRALVVEKVSTLGKKSHPNRWPLGYPVLENSDGEGSDVALQRTNLPGTSTSERLT